MTTVSVVSRSPLPTRLELFNEKGGQSRIYLHPTDPELLIKVFIDETSSQPQAKTGREADRVEAIADFSRGRFHSQALRLQESMSWPVELYGPGPGVVDGIAIRRAPEDFWVDLAVRNFKSNVPLRETRFQDFSYLMSHYLGSAAVVDAPYTDVTFENRIEIAIELLLTMRLVWRLGYRYCDFKPYNLSWTIQGRPRVFVIDTDTLTPPGERGPHTPGEWWPLATLMDRMESDRSLCVRTMWRVLAKDMGSTPGDGRGHGDTTKLDNITVDLFVKAHETGTADVVELLRADLQRYRSAINADLAFEWALSTGYARLVAECAPPKPSRAQQELIDRAVEQMRVEEELMALPAVVRSVRLNLKSPLPGLQWDIPQDAAFEHGDSSHAALRDLALQGHFDEIASEYIGSGAEEESSRLVMRSVQVALSALGEPPIHVRSSASGEMRVEWSWPGGALVAGAAISVTDPSTGVTLFEKFADKRRHRPSMSLPQSSPSLSRVVCTVSYASVTTSASVIVCPLVAVIEVDLPVSTASSPRTPWSAPHNSSVPAFQDLPRTFVRVKPPVSDPDRPVLRPPGRYADLTRQYDERWFDGSEYTSLDRHQQVVFDEKSKTPVSASRLRSIGNRLKLMFRRKP